MGNYINSLDSTAKQNLDLVVNAVRNSSVSNRDAQAAILAIIAKESGFKLRPETSYSGTSNDRIRAIFGSRVSSLSDSQLTALKKNDKDFFEKVYGKGSGAPLGNTQPGDGYKYRGRGFNQLTGRSNYDFYGKNIGVNLIDNPDLLNDPAIAAKAAVQYFIIQSMLKGNKLNEYNAVNINDFKNLTDSTGAMFHANAGWGKSKQTLQGDPTGGYAKAMANAQEFYDYLSAGEKKSLMNSPGLWIGILLLVALFIFFWMKR